MDQPLSTLIDLLAAATLHKNTFRGTNNASAFELSHDREPDLSTECNSTTHGWQEDSAVTARWCQLHASLPNSVCNSSVFNVGQTPYFWRENNSWKRPGKIVKVQEHAVDIAHAGVFKTTDCSRVREDAQMFRVIVDIDTALHFEDGTERSSSTEQQERADADDGDG